VARAPTSWSTAAQRPRRWAIAAAVPRALALGLCLFGAGHAWAGDFADDVESAKAAYFEGELQQSLEAFQALQLRALQDVDELPWAEVVEALTYLGELHVKLGDDDAAKRVFRFVLERDLDTPISPYRHPIEVVFVFNQVRDKIAAERAMEAPDPTRVPAPRWHAHLPLGLPQLAQGRTGAGVAYGVTQLALGGVAVGMFVELQQVNTDPATHPRGWTEEQVLNRGAVRKFAVQWPATIGFYSVWAVSVLDARARWRRDHTPATVSWAPAGPGGPGLSILGRF